MKLLSVCVPTYNRASAFKNLYETFLFRALREYGDLVELVVCDNSDESTAVANKGILDPRIKYYHNEGNIGFAGNLSRCVRESTSKYIWIISDDDLIVWEGFSAMLRTLQENECKDIDCFMVPFFSKTPYGDIVSYNRAIDWHLKSETTAAELVATNQCPFVLFSGGVLRVDKSSLAQIPKKYLKNAYLQTVLFLSMLRADSKIKFLNDAAIEYQPGYVGQTIGVLEMAASLVEVREYTEERFGAKPAYDSDYRGWLLWMFHHRGGFYYLLNADSERWELLSNLHKHLSVKSLLLAIAIVLPKFLARPIYLVYKTLTDARVYGRTDLRDIALRLSVNHKFISEIRRRHPVS